MYIACFVSDSSSPPNPKEEDLSFYLLILINVQTQANPNFFQFHLSTNFQTLISSNPQTQFTEMHTRLVCSNSSDFSDNRTDMPRETDAHPSSSSTTSSSSASTAGCTEVLNYYLWIPLLISLTKGLNSAKAQSISTGSLSSCPAPDSNLYYRPVIGILTHPGDGASGRLNNDTNASYIAASYVKFVEAAGARVIPLIYNEPWEILSEKLNLVNGVLFTGGWAKTGLYYETVQGIFEKILERNDAGDHFPLLAICLGFELLNMIISKDNNILEKFRALAAPSTLQFTKPTTIEGTVFQRFPPELLKKLSTDCLVMQNHQYGVSPERFQENPSLRGFFRVLTTTTDEDNKVYISTIQARNYPITASQWHPEKNAFEWGLSMIPHSEDAVQVTQHVANYFISEARKSLNRPPARKVLENLIYNYSPTFCGKAGRGYDEVYIFSESSILKIRSGKGPGPYSASSFLVQ